MGGRNGHGVEQQGEEERREDHETGADGGAARLRELRGLEGVGERVGGLGMISVWTCGVVNAGWA